MLVINSSSNEALWNIDPNNPASTTPPYGRLDGLPTGIRGSADGAASTGSRLLLVHYDSGTQNTELWRINPADPDSTSGVYGKVGNMPSGLDGAHAMAFHGAQLYVISENDHLWRINTSSPGSTAGIYGDLGDLDTEVGLFRPYALVSHSGQLFMLDYYIIHTVRPGSSPLAVVYGETPGDVNLPSDLRVSGATSHTIT